MNRSQESAEMQLKIYHCTQTFEKDYHQQPTKVILSENAYNFLSKKGVISTSKIFTDLNPRDRLIGRGSKLRIFMESELSESKQSELKTETSGLEMPITLARRGGFNGFKQMQTYDLGWTIKDLALER